MAYFPMYIELTDRKCLVVGGGNVAAGKIRQLVSFGAAVTVIAPEIGDEVRALAKERGVSLQIRPFEKRDIEGVALAVAATDDESVNRQVSTLCKAAGIPVNVADDKELCSFYFPAIVRRKDVVTAVSTGGNSPALAAYLRRELETHIPERYGRAAETLGAYREAVKDAVPDSAARRRVFERMLARYLAQDGLSAEEVKSIIEEETDGAGCRRG